MSNAYYLFKKGKRFAERGKFLSAIMALEKARELEPEKGSIRETLASVYYNCGFYQPARKNFLKALEIDASNDFAHYGLGMCFIKEKQFNKAAGHLKMAYAMKPNSKKYKEALKKIT